VHRILCICALITLCTSAQAAINLDIDTRAQAEERARDVAVSKSINKKTVKEDKYLSETPAEFEGMDKENAKRVNEFSQLPTKKKSSNKGNNYVY
jgi:hypothetical protein